MSVTTAPTFEHHRDPLGIGEPSPRLSWKTTAPPGWRQGGYEVEAQRAGVRHATGWVASDRSVLVDWPFPPLASRERAVVRVRVRGEDGDVGPWSPQVAVEAGLLAPADWSARMVAPSWDEDRDAVRRPPLVRTSFRLTGDVERARLYVTAHGLYEVEINGRRVGDDVLSPGWTSYEHRLRYRTYDVADHLRLGENVIGAWLGDGWYRGRLGFDGGHANVYGDDIGLLAQVEILQRGGASVTVVTDESWVAAFGPVHASGLLDGESYDARDEIPGWSSPGVDDARWSRVRVVARDPSTLVAPNGPPVRCTQELRPQRVDHSSPDRVILDFGQNLVGRLRLTLEGAAGHMVSVRHAEILQDGRLCVRPLRDAKATDTYVLRGGGPETWEPRFTIHGFRYAEITGWPGGDPARDVVARVYHTDMERTGWFKCSDPLVNRLHENVVWSMRGNFVDLPTDCPQRDERLGWTGDIQVFAPTAAFLYDCHGLLVSWLQDVALEQLPDGTVPWYVPAIPGGAQWTPIRPGAGWGDVVALTPWALYQARDDRALLARQYDSARAWVDLVSRLAGPSRLWNRGFQLGDWLDPSAPPEDPGGGATDRHLVATAYFAWSARHVALMAGVLGRHEDEARYSGLAREVRRAFAREYVLPDGRLTSDTQTATSISLEFDLLPTESDRERAGRHLARLVADGGHTVRTGFVGTPLVAPALTSTGHLESAYALLLQRKCPSWLYAVTHGATTIWERWDSLLPDGTVHPGGMTSFNHYAYGAVASWLHTVVAGLRSEAPGYRTIAFRPRPGGGLTWARAEHESPYGRVAVHWQVDGTELEIRTTVPTGATARIDWPDGVVTVVPTGRATHRRLLPTDDGNADPTALLGAAGPGDHELGDVT